MNPHPGTFLRPVSCLRMGYCIEVMRVIDAEDDSSLNQWQVRRHGMRDGQPHNDGGPQNMLYLDGIEHVGSGIYRERQFSGSFDLAVTYFREITLRGQQMELFI
jgi:hypothetical protein